MSVVFALGSNGSGQLGIAHKEDVSVPKQVLFHPDPPSGSVSKVVAGGNHTLLLTTTGELFWSGDASTGACGLISELSNPEEPVFQKVQLSKTALAGRPVKLVAATWEASIIVQADDQGRCTRVSSFGVGQKGELGQGQFIIRTPSASLIPDFPPPDTEVVDLAASMGHVVAVLDNGDAYGWGNGRKGQIGSPEAIVQEPRKIDGVHFKVARVVCGREFTCLVGPQDEGKILILGSDKWGVKGSAPAQIPGWVDVGAGWSNIYVLKGDGTLVNWGRDDHGQLRAPRLPMLSRISVGSEHVIGLTHDGEVVAWGWGEHGNCGPQVENGDVKGRWNVIASSKYIPPGSSITAIGAGCATSWVTIDSAR